MTSPYIRLSKAAINAKLTQNEGLIFHALMMQTLGYRKSVDNLTDKRLAQLAGIRLDHFRPALESFLNHNLFYRIEHRDYDYQYRICDEFLDETQASMVYPPSLPKQTAVQTTKTPTPNLGESTAPTLGTLPEPRADVTPTLGNLTNVGAETPPTLGSFPELGGHTTENLYIKKQQQTKTETEKTFFEKKQQTKPKKNKTEKTIAKEQQPTVTIFMAGLESLPEQFVIESSQPLRIEFSSSNIGIGQNHVAKKTKSQHPVSDTHSETLPQPIATPPISHTANTQQAIKTEKASNPVVTPSTHTSPSQTMTQEIAKLADKPDLKPIAAAIISAEASSLQHQAYETLPETPATTEKTNVVVSEIEMVKKPLAIPKAVGEENYNACNRYFEDLNEQLKKDVLTVFFYNLKVGKIRNKASYFIGLTQKAKTAKGLSVPHEATLKPAVSLSPEQQVAKKKANEEREYRTDRWADYQWIVRHAASQNKSEAEIAKDMGLEEALMLFGTPAAAVAQHEEDQELQACVA